MGARRQTGLRIAFCFQDLDWTPSMTEGASVQTHEITAALRAAGHTVELVASRWGKRVLRSEDADWSRDNLLNCESPLWLTLTERMLRSLQGRLRLPWLQVFDSLRLARYLAGSAARFDVLYERNSHHGVGVALAARQLGAPYVIHYDADVLAERDMVGATLSRADRAVVTWTLRHNLRAAHGITCVSHEARARLLQLHSVDPRKVTVIPNGAPLRSPCSEQAAMAERTRLGLGHAPVAVFIGSFWAWHDLHMLLDSFVLVRRRMPEARLLLVGDGRTRAEIERYAAALGLGDHVIFTGAVAYERVPLLLALADVAVAPYAPTDVGFIGSPMKLFEYMGAGKAVVATAIGQIPGVIETGYNGMLVPVGDSRETAEALAQLLGDASRREAMGAAARATIEAGHSWAHYVTKLEAVFAKACFAMAQAAGRP